MTVPVEQSRYILGEPFYIEVEQQQHCRNQESVGKIGSHQPLGPFGCPAQIPPGFNRLKYKSAKHKEQRHPEPGQIMIRCRIAGVAHYYKNNTESLGGINP